VEFESPNGADAGFEPKYGRTASNGALERLESCFGAVFHLALICTHRTHLVVESFFRGADGLAVCPCQGKRLRRWQTARPSAPRKTPCQRGGPKGRDSHNKVTGPSLIRWTSIAA